MVGMHDDISLNTSEWEPSSEDLDSIKAHVVELEHDGFFKRVPEPERGSVESFVTMGAYAAQMRYQLLKTCDTQLALNSELEPTIKRIGDSAETLLSALADLKKRNPEQFCFLGKAYKAFALSETDQQPTKQAAPQNLLQHATAIARAVRYYSNHNPIRGKQRPKQYHDEDLIRSLARLYERVPGNVARVSAVPGGSTATGPFVRFLEGWWRVIDSERENWPSKSFIQRALSAHKKSEDAIEDFNLAHSNRHDEV